MTNTTATEDREIGNAEGAIQRVIEIAERLDRELTEANDTIKQLNERISDLESERQ